VGVKSHFARQHPQLCRPHDLPGIIDSGFVVPQLEDVKSILT